MKLAIEVEVKDEDLMSTVFDNLWTSSSPWVQKYTWDWEAKPLQTAVEVAYADPENYPGLAKKVVTVEMLGEALATLISKGSCHCGGIPITADLDEADSCWADFILQYALFGELVYG